MARFQVSDTVYKHPLYGNYKIIKRDSAHKITIKFENTGYESVVEHSALHTNTVRDYEAPSVCGVGVIGHEYKNMTQKFKSAKSCWGDMLLRCYDKSSPSYRNYGGRGVTVCNEWHRFGNFLLWYQSNHQEGYHLDKDLLNKKESKVYSPETCMFLPKEVNLYLRYPNKDNGLPQGVCVNSRRPDRYCAYIQYASTGLKKNLGSTFRTPESAFSVYCKEKMKDKSLVADLWFEKGLIDEQTRCLLKEYIIHP